MAGARPTDVYVPPKPGLLDVSADAAAVDPSREVKATGSLAPTAQPAAKQKSKPAGLDATGQPVISGVAPPGMYPGVDILGNPVSAAHVAPVSARDALGRPIAVNDARYTPLKVTDINTARNAAVQVRKQQGALTPQLQAAAEGAVPSAAQIASRAALNKQSLDAARAAAAIRGGAPGIFAAQHAAASALPGMQGAVVSQGGAAREAELQRAQAVLAQHLLTTRGGDLAIAGNDIATANANANIAQGSQIANQANALRVGQANLTNEVNAGSLDLNDATRAAIERQTTGLAQQEALDQRALGLAGVDLGWAQNSANAVNASNAGYLGRLGLTTQGQGLQYEQKGINAGIDAGYLSALMGGAAVLPALASMPGAPAPAPAAAPASVAAPAPAYQPPAYQPPSIATPALTLAPMPTPQNMYAQFGMGGY